MVNTTLLLASSLTVAAAIVYAFVGRRLGKRQVSPDGKLANDLFVVWWFGLAATTSITAVNNIATALDAGSLELLVSLTYVNLLLVCVALWGLLYYLLFLFTGKRRLLEPLTAFYVVVYVYLLYTIVAANPIDVRVNRWSSTLVYEHPFDTTTTMLLVALILLPQIFGALAYFTLTFRLKDRTQRFRVTMVSWAIIVWFSSSLVASASGLSANDNWQIASRLIGLGAAVAIYFAYQPPGWMRRRFNIAAVGDEPPPAPVNPERAPSGPKSRGSPSGAVRSPWAI